jgi:NAD(P)-dependent dehydrogenase (short-subunit alcohol dehydrogenase family)
MFLIQSFAKHAIKRGGGGRIVVVTSSGAFRAVKNRAAYGASKAGLTNLVRIAAAQLGPHDINVNAVAPGTTNTYGITTARNVDISVLQKSVSEGPFANFFKRVTEPEDVGATIAFLCTPGSRQITGQTIHVSAGLHTP